MANKTTGEGVLERSARILDVFGLPPFNFAFSEICDRVDLPSATVHRMLNQLLEIGYLSRLGDGKSYILGPRLKQMLHFNADKSELDATFHPVLAKLANDCGKTTFAARLRGDDISIFSVAQPADPDGTQVVPGYGTRPVNACSSAKAILAFQDKDFVDAALAKPMQAFTDRTITDPDEFRTEMIEVRKTRVAMCDEEIDISVLSLASPVSVQGVGVIYAIGAIGLKAAFSDAKIAALRDQLVKSAERLSEAL